MPGAGSAPNPPMQHGLSTSHIIHISCAVVSSLFMQPQERWQQKPPFGLSELF
jgi:hypothetical protein